MAQEGSRDTGGHLGGVDGACRWPEEAGAGDTFTVETDGGPALGHSRTRPHSSGDEGGSSSRRCTRLQRRRRAWHSGQRGGCARWTGEWRREQSGVDDESSVTRR
jgi:hypothetical protein